MKGSQVSPLADSRPARVWAAGLAVMLLASSMATSVGIASVQTAKLARGELGGGAGPGEPADCLSDLDRKRVAAVIEEYENHRDDLRGALPKYAFYPMAGNLYGDLFTNNFVDLDPGPGLLDWDCSGFTYNGHDASDVDIRGFGEQDIGVPVFAAADGVVVDSHDGEFDRNTCPSVCQSGANYVIIDHGGGRLAYYWHLKKDSVAVAPGESVRAGQQIGLAASSGNSSHPHLHFATYDDGRLVEPYAGGCRAGESEWLHQEPIERSTYLRDFGLTPENLGQHPGFPHEFPRSGQIGFDDSRLYVWALPHNLPPQSTWRFRFERPNGTISYDSGSRPFNNGGFYRWSWWWWWWDIAELRTIEGTWRVELWLNGELYVAAPLEVKPMREPGFNRAPEPIAVRMDPPHASENEAIFCRVHSDLVLDDLDYDIVRYRYLWRVDGTVVRDVTSAGMSDALPAGVAGDCSEVICDVTPSDGKDDGQTKRTAITTGILGKCGTGAVNAGCGDPADVLRVNGSTGGPTRTVHLSPDSSFAITLAEPPSRAGDGMPTELCAYAWVGVPGIGDVVTLPRGFGPMCFGPLVLATREPTAVWNSIGLESTLGEDTAPGPPPVIPDSGVATLRSIPGGLGRVLTVTLQAIVRDTCSLGSTPLSVTNAVVVRVE